MQGTRQISLMVGQNIRARRVELGLSRTALARRMPCKVNENAIYRWERGVHRPTDRYFVALAEALDREISWFYTDHDEPMAA